nr:hypothetical protein [Tanacetum cinerariifolium]
MGHTKEEKCFEQTKECNLTEVIPFFKTLKEHFEGVQKSLIKEVKEMNKIFDELEAEVEQHVMDRECDAIERKNLLIANENLIVDCLSKDVFYTATHFELIVSRFSEMHDAYTVVQARVNSYTEASRLKPKSNTKKNKIMPAKNDNKKKVEAYPSNNKSNLKQKNLAKKPIPKVIFKSHIPIKGCVLGLSNVETWDNIVKKFRMRTPERCADKSKGKRKNHLMEIQADDHDLLVNSDNKNDDMLGYEFEKEYGKPGRIKIKVTFDALNKVSGLYKALFSSFLGDLVREHIVRKLVMHRLGKLLRKFRMKLREKYILPNLNTPSKLNELPAKYSATVKAEESVEFVNYTTVDAHKNKNKEIKTDEEPSRGVMWLKGRVNKYREFIDDEIRSKEADDEIKEGTLNLDDGTDAMTVVFGKEKGGYARGVTLMGAYEVDKTQSSVVVRDKDARIHKKSNGLVTSEKEPVKTVRHKKTHMLQRNGSQDS